MAGINVPQYDVFKIGTRQLAFNNWNLTLSLDEAYRLQEVVSLFEGQEFRLIAQILRRDIRTVDFSKYIFVLVIDKASDFRRATSKKGVVLNGGTFHRFVGTSGGLKKNTLIYVNDAVLPELNERCECGRRMDIKLVPAKYEAYKALTCSASQPICEPRGILVVNDCVTHIKDTVISIEDGEGDAEPVVRLDKDADIEVDASDGFNLCTIDYMRRVGESLGLDYAPSGVCLRNAWLKGMMYPFPILEFIEKYNNGNYMIKDIWGNEQDIRNVDMILTESSLKLWDAYGSINDYIAKYRSNGYCFAVTKISSHHLDDVRDLNYQYLQSYEFTDEDIEEICKPTVDKLKNAMCGDYQATLDFLGINEGVEKGTWQHALYVNSCMMEDSYVIDSVHRMIKKKIDDAKIGKLEVHGNYQIASGDPFALMQSLCGLEVTGLLKAEEVYSHYWAEQDVDDVVVFRSPMTSHNNIRRCKVVNNDEVNEWYRYMDDIMIINAWDTFMAAENGCDFDGDLLFSTNNPVLLRRHRKLPAICCIQRKANKVIPDEKAILKSNMNGMGNKVGSITNRVTAMMEKLAHFDKDTDEYKEIEYRILTGQLHQQNEIDKIKGIIAKPMPTYWYNYHACADNEWRQKLCTEKKPYFMIYVYDDYKRDYNKYNRQCDKTARLMLGKSLKEVLAEEHPTENEQEFIDYYHRREPFGTGACAMNRICWHIENEFDGLISTLKQNSHFDYHCLKSSNATAESKYVDALKNLQKKYISSLRSSKKMVFEHELDKESRTQRRVMMKKYFKARAAEICPNDEERMNTILDITYGEHGNRQFCWDCVGDLIVNQLKLKEETDDNIQ